MGPGADLPATVATLAAAPPGCAMRLGLWSEVGWDTSAAELFSAMAPLAQQPGRLEVLGLCPLGEDLPQAVDSLVGAALPQGPCLQLLAVTCELAELEEGELEEVLRTLGDLSLGPGPPIDLVVDYDCEEGGPEEDPGLRAALRAAAAVVGIGGALPTIELCTATRCDNMLVEDLLKEQEFLTCSVYMEAVLEENWYRPHRLAADL